MAISAPRKVALASAAMLAFWTVAPVLPAAHAAGTPGWRVFRLFSPHRFKNLIGFTANGPKDAWAFGDGPRHPVAVHWNGSTWTGAVLPGANARPEQASSTSLTNVWASGHRCNSGPPAPPGSSAYISRWNGRSWATSQRKQLPFCPVDLVTTGPRQGWLFGFAQAMRISRGFGTVFSFGAGRQVLTATASGAANVWAFGSGPMQKGFAVRWNGHRWQSMSMPNLNLAKGSFFDPTASDAVSAHDVWVCGVITHQHLPVLLNWTGSRWRRIRVPGRISLTALTTDGHGGVWMLGVTTGGAYSFLHYAKGKVTSRPMPTKGLPGVTAHPTFDVFALGAIPGTTSVWATGDVSYVDAKNVGHSYTVIFKYGK
jgi:hypothetical protein